MKVGEGVVGQKWFGKEGLERIMGVKHNPTTLRMKL